MLGDNQGTIRDVVDSSGNLINHIVYDSFGKVQSQSNAGYDLRFGYTGREQDGETGLNYYRARYYDASNGRFISEDPSGFGAGDGNLTRYTFNSPTIYNDPSGQYSRNLRVLLALTKPDQSSSVRQYSTEFSNYPTALTSATSWFYLISVDYARERNLNANPKNRPNKPEWIIYGPLRNTSGSQDGGAVNLRPGGSSGRYPTIDLAEDRTGRKHNTPGYEQIKEVKFKYKGNPEDKTKCPVLFPNPEPKLQDVLQKKEPQKIPDFTPASSPRKSNDIDNSWWWTIPIGGALKILEVIFGNERRI